MKRLLATCLLGLLLLLAHLAGAQAQLTEQVNFDDVADGTRINNTYAGSGVTFDCRMGISSTLNACLNTNGSGVGGKVFARTPSFSPTNFNYTCNQTWLVNPHAAHSPNNIVSIFSPGSCPENQTFFNEDNGYLEARFPTPATSVSVWVNAVLPFADDGTHQGGTLNMPYMRAFDAQGNLLGTATYYGSILNASLGWVELTLSSGILHSPPIARVELSSSTSAPEFPVWAEFDDLSFTVPSATVPNVVGMTVPNTESSIAAANLTTGTVSQQPSSTVAKGDVISQSPAATTVVIEGSAVNVTESCGAPVTVPLVVGMSDTVAESEIVSAGLTVGTATYVRNSAPLGHVLSTNPVGFTANVCPGTAVNLVISAGPYPPKLP